MREEPRDLSTKTNNNKFFRLMKYKHILFK